MKYSAAAICALLVATAAAMPAGVLEASGRPAAVAARDCYCAPIPGACADSCGNAGACWSNCWGGGPWGKTAPTEDVAEAE